MNYLFKWYLNHIKFLADFFTNRFKYQILILLPVKMHYTHDTGQHPQLCLRASEDKEHSFYKLKPKLLIK